MDLFYGTTFVLTDHDTFRLGIDHNSVELPDLINLIIVMHILKKRLDKFLKYTFPLE